MRRSLAASVLAIGLLVAAAPGVFALNVERAAFENQYPFDASSMCGFPVAGQAHTWGHYTFLSRGDDPELSEPVREVDHIWEQDTLLGPTQTITSEPYRYNGHITYTPGWDWTAAAATGVLARFILPDGTQVLMAGRMDYITGATVGAPGDSAALCAYLSS